MCEFDCIVLCCHYGVIKHDDYLHVVDGYAVFLLCRLPIESRVYMADGLPILIEFDSASTAAEVWIWISILGLTSKPSFKSVLSNIFNNFVKSWPILILSPLCWNLFVRFVGNLIFYPKIKKFANRLRLCKVIAEIRHLILETTCTSHKYVVSYKNWTLTFDGMCFIDTVIFRAKHETMLNKSQPEFRNIYCLYSLSFNDCTCDVM